MDSAKSRIRYTLDQVKALLDQDTPPKLSEADTKANFIEPLISALGWNGIGIVTREYYVRNSQEFIDYVLSDGGRPILAIEAKSIPTGLSDKAAAQLIQYCAVDGIEWAALTNGRELQFFNTFLKPDLEAKRVLRIDLLAFNTDEEFEALYQHVRQLSRESMTAPAGVRTWLNQRRMDETLRSVLLDQTSPAVRALRRALSNAEVKATPIEITNWVRKQLHAGPDLEPVVSTNDGTSVAPPKPLPPVAVTGVIEGNGETRNRDFDPLTSHVFEGKHQGLLSLLVPLVERVSERLPGTEWRSMKWYIAAEHQGQTILSVKRRGGSLLLGLALPRELEDQRFAEDSAIFKWPRITKAVRISTIQDIDDQLIDLIERANAHVHSTALGGKKYFGVSLKDMVAQGIVRPAERLQLMRGSVPVAVGVITEFGQIECNGSVFSSPSDRTFARLLGRQSLNGWTAWYLIRPEGRVSLASLRDQLLATGTGRTV